MDWLPIIDQKIEIYDINEMLKGKTIEDIDEIICIGNVNLYEWLNQYYTLWIEGEGKEDFIEKWSFNIGSENLKNFVIVKFGEDIKADLIVSEKYKVFEKDIINQIEEKLGLLELGDTVSYDIYYYKYAHNVKTENTPEYSIEVLITV